MDIKLFLFFKSKFSSAAMYFVLMLGLMAHNCYALSQSEALLEEKDLPTESLSMLNPSALGDAYDPVSGSVNFAVTDISIPGNFDIPVEFRRAYHPNKEKWSSRLGGWEMDVPYVSGNYFPEDVNLPNAPASSPGGVSHWDGWSDGKECEGDAMHVTLTSPGQNGSRTSNASAWWGGKKLHIPDGVSENLIVGVGDGAGQLAGEQATSSLHKVTHCFTRDDGKGQGIEVTAPNGTVYRFSHVIERASSRSSSALAGQLRVRYLMVERITDKFGNYVSFDWNANDSTKLDAIRASDGRELILSYLPSGLLDSVEANGRTWHYSYTTYVAPENNVGSKKLYRVTRPDTKYWRYSYDFYDQRKALTQTQYASYPAWHCETTSRYYQDELADSFYVDTPEGARITYYFDTVRHSKSNVVAWPENRDPHSKQYSNVHCEYRRNLVKRRVAVGGESYTWDYSYSENQGHYLRQGSGATDTDIANQNLVGSKYPSYIAPLPGSISSSLHMKTT